MPDLSVARAALIIPAYNEAPVIAATLGSIPAGLFELVIVADNGSTDGTAKVAAAAGATVVRTPVRGYGAGCLAAIAALPPEINVVVFLQADGSEDATEAKILMQPLLEGRADLVLGSRTMGKAEPGSLLPHQEFGNWLASFLIRVLFGHVYTDLGPFRAIRRDKLDALGMGDRNYGWTVEMQVRALQKGLRVMEVPVRYGRRTAGVNKVSGNWKGSLRAGWVIVGTILRLRMGTDVAE